MLRPYLKIWEWELIFGRAVKAFPQRASVARAMWQSLQLFNQVDHIYQNAVKCWNTFCGMYSTT